MQGCIGKNNKVCVLLPYYGKLPACLPLFLESCRLNPWIDFIFFTDETLPPNRPANVKLVPLLMASLRQIAASKLGCEVALHTGYKLCDLKPAYGAIFEDYLHQYSYWAHGDIDLIYGLIESFVPETVFHSRKFDILRFRTEWMYGPLTFFLNVPAVNLLFRESPDWKEVCLSTNHFGFDECGKCHAMIRNGHDVEHIMDELVCMTEVVNRAVRDRRITVFATRLVKESIGEKDWVKFSPAGVQDSTGKQYLLYHFVTEKRKRYFKYPKWRDVPLVYFITQTGFYTETEFPHRKLIGTIRWLSSVPAQVVDFFRRLASKLGLCE